MEPHGKLSHHLYEVDIVQHLVLSYFHVSGQSTVINYPLIIL